MHSDFYVYAYYVPGEFTPIYIGKGRGDRCYQHLQLYKSRTRGMFRSKLISLQRQGIRPLVLKLYENLTEEQAFEKERMLIKLYGRRDIGTGCLCNHTDGGDGVSGYIASDSVRVIRANNMRETIRRTPLEQLRARALVNAIAGRKPVESFDLGTGQTIKSYSATIETKKDGHDPATVTKCCKGKQKHHHGLGWRYCAVKEVA